MKFAYQFIFSIKRLLANTGALVTKIVVFVILILILGSVFESSFEGSSIDGIKIAYVVEDNGDIGEAIMTAMVENEEIGEYLTFEKEEDFSVAEQLLADGEIDAVMLVPEDFSNFAQQKNSEETLEVYMTSYADINASVIKSCTQGFLSGMNAAMAVRNMTGEATSEIQQDSPCEELGVEGNSPDSMTYYAIAMLLMMLVYGADYGNNSTAEEYFGALGDRMRMAPISQFSRLVGRMTGIALVNFLLGCIVVIFSGLVFHVNWGANIPMLLLILYVFSLLCTVFGAALCLILGNEQRATGAIQMFALGFTIVSGGFYAGDFKKAKCFSFNHYAKTAINNLLFNGSDLTTTWKNLGILVALTIVFSIVCVVCGRMRKEGHV